MPVQDLGTDRYAALKATEKFSTGTVGYGVHQGINLLVDGLFGIGDGFGNRYSARVGEFFQKPEVQALMAKPIGDFNANRLVAQMEFEYWTSVKNDPNASISDKLGAAIALQFSIDDRATLQEYFAKGQTTKAYLLITRIFPEGFSFGFLNFVENLAIDTIDYVKSVKDYLSNFCFCQGTPILMPDGTYTPIEQIKIGDEVMAFDGLGELQPRKVTQTFITPDQKVVQLGNINVTLGHHFLQADGSFKALGEIDNNGFLVGVTGKLIPHPGIKSVEGKHTVYNFTVEELHTYIAGDYRVHNESLSLYQPVTTGGFIGASIGSQIGSLYANDKFASQLVAQSLGKTVGSWVGDAVVYEFDLLDDPAFQARSQHSLSLGAIYKRLPANIISTGIGLQSGRLANSLIKTFKIEDRFSQIAFSGLITTTTSNYITTLAATHLDAETAIKFFGAPGKYDSFGNLQGVDWEQLKLVNSLAATAGSIVGSYYSAKLSNVLFNTDSMESQIAANLATTIGATIGQSLIPIPFVGAAIGAAVGNLVGSWYGSLVKSSPVIAFALAPISFGVIKGLGKLFGGLFGGKNPPLAIGDVNPDYQQGLFVVGNIATNHGGSYELAQQMTEAAKNSLNIVLLSVGGKLVYAKGGGYGHYKAWHFRANASYASKTLRR